MTHPLAIEWAEKRVSVADLKPYERNPCRISESAFNRLKESLKETGYHQRIIAQPDLRVIGGHQRIRALRELGLESVTVLIPNRELTPEEFNRLLVQDNLEFGEFDFKMLGQDFTIAQLTGWGMDKDLLQKVPRPLDDDKAEETPLLPTTAISRLGDLWRLDQHRVLCGDSTSTADVAALLGPERPHLMVTDPPYGVEYDADWRNRSLRTDGSPIGGRATGKVENDDSADWRAAWGLFPGRIAYVWHGGLHASIVAQSLEAAQFKLRAQIIWAKSNFAIGRGDYHWQHEPCWYAVRGTGDWHGDRKQTTVWNIDKPQKSETGHSTQKPVECMRRPMMNNSKEGDLIYDPFLGSGTTIIAAEQIGRHCLGLELNPLYVDVIVRRWMQFTGKEAILDGTDQSFDQIARSRI